MTFAFWSLFFFSSRRRHTRFSRDWSSDVCSSDLSFAMIQVDVAAADHGEGIVAAEVAGARARGHGLLAGVDQRSEERRVGKEGRSRGSRGERRKRGGVGGRDDKVSSGYASG